MLKSKREFSNKFSKWLYTLIHLPKLLDCVHRQSIEIDDLKKETRNLRTMLNRLTSRDNVVTIIDAKTVANEPSVPIGGKLN